VAWRLLHPPAADPVLAAAEHDLDGGRPAAAVGRLEDWLQAEHPPAERQRAQGLLERAAYEAARAELAQGHFAKVQTLTGHLADQGITSARLRNLALQAERSIPAEFALAVLGMLTAYGYELDGSSPRKALPDQNRLTERLDREWQEAVGEHPRDGALFVNRG